MLDSHVLHTLGLLFLLFIIISMIIICIIIVVAVFTASSVAGGSTALFPSVPRLETPERRAAKLRWTPSWTGNDQQIHRTHYGKEINERRHKNANVLLSNVWMSAGYLHLLGVSQKPRI